MSERHACGRPLKDFIRSHAVSGALALLVVCADTAPAGAQSADGGSFPDRNNAFAGVAFGTALEEAQQKWQLEEIEGASVPDDPVRLYLREEESHVLGGVMAREVVYYFLNGRFYAVAFSTPDTRQTDILRQALDLGYAAEPHANGDTSLVWPGQLVSAQLQVNPATGEGRALLFSNELQADYEKSLKESAAKTAAGM